MEQERKDREASEHLMGEMREDLDCRIHDQKIASDSRTEAHTSGKSILLSLDCSFFLFSFFHSSAALFNVFFHSTVLCLSVTFVVQNLNPVIYCTETKELRVLLRLDYDFCVWLSVDSLNTKCLI